jgi:hypothetical protein
MWPPFITRRQPDQRLYRQTFSHTATIRVTVMCPARHTYHQNPHRTTPGLF